MGIRSLLKNRYMKKWILLLIFTLYWVINFSNAAYLEEGKETCNYQYVIKSEPYEVILWLVESINQQNYAFKTFVGNKEYIVTKNMISKDYEFIDFLDGESWRENNADKDLMLVWATREYVAISPGGKHVAFRIIESGEEWSSINGWKHTLVVDWKKIHQYDSVKNISFSPKTWLLTYIAKKDKEYAIVYGENIADWHRDIFEYKFSLDEKELWYVVENDRERVLMVNGQEYKWKNDAFTIFEENSVGVKDKKFVEYNFDNKNYVAQRNCKIIEKKKNWLWDLFGFFYEM
jgi:hypothetical protein